MNNIQEFFDNKSSSWDEKEQKSSEFFDMFVKKFLPLKVNDRVLDLACGTGVISNSIFKITNAEVLGLDLSPKMIEIAKEKYRDNPKISFKAIDFYQSNLNGFDVIICHNAYPHFLDKEAFARKCYDTLNENGRLYICHSISRDEVNNIHKKVDHSISSCLDTPTNEYKYFEKYFVLNATLDDKYYLISMSKK